jgi:hypothetical protein
MDFRYFLLVIAIPRDELRMQLVQSSLKIKVVFLKNQLMRMFFLPVPHVRVQSLCSGGT